MEFEFADLLLDGNIEEVKIGCKNNAILKHIKFMDVYFPGELSSIDHHIHAFNRWEIKFATLNKLIVQDFRHKFDFEHAYCCIGEMLRHFAHINLPFAFDIFIRLSTRLIKHSDVGNVRQLQMMVQVFNTL
jgi:hypothetical protein